ncbi:MAG: hypothetical protein H5U00_09455, partial [Clostridia bacterium]|nr:hypothetical protein [Clostridia bacterium]
MPLCHRLPAARRANKPQKMFPALAALALLLIAAACESPTATDDGVVALVNGEKITLREVERVIREGEVGLQIASRLRELEPGPSPEQLDAAKLAAALGLDPGAMSEEEARFCRRLERNLERRKRPPDRNEAFNQLVREEVLYQEAVKRGLGVSLAEARELQQQVDEASWKMFEREGRWQEVLKIEQEGWQALGYRSWEEWKEAVLPSIARDASIKRLKDWFEEQLAASHPEAQGVDFLVLKENAWEDYTEHLLRRAQIKIQGEDFSLEFYGAAWRED